MKRTLVFALAFGLACESGPVSDGPASGSPTPASPGAAPSSAPAAQTPGAAPVTKAYGAAFEDAPEVSLATILSNPHDYAGKTITTQGKVQRACSRKGCWMEIGEGDNACRVTFKDYGFFVPTNSAGAHARLQGRVETSRVERAAVEHLESEGARFQAKSDDGTATEVRLVASAVQLTR